MEWDRRSPLHRLLHQYKHRCLHWCLPARSTRRAQDGLRRRVTAGFATSVGLRPPCSQTQRRFLILIGRALLILIAARYAASGHARRRRSCYARSLFARGQRLRLPAGQRSQSGHNFFYVYPNPLGYGDAPVRPMPRITAGSLLNLILPYSAVRRSAARSARAPTLQPPLCPWSAPRWGGSHPATSVQRHPSPKGGAPRPPRSDLQSYVRCGGNT